MIIVALGRDLTGPEKNFLAEAGRNHTLQFINPSEDTAEFCNDGQHRRGSCHYKIAGLWGLRKLLLIMLDDIFLSSAQHFREFVEEFHRSGRRWRFNDPVLQACQKSSKYSNGKARMVYGLTDSRLVQWLFKYYGIINLRPATIAEIIKG